MNRMLVYLAPSIPAPLTGASLEGDKHGSDAREGSSTAS